MKKTILLMLIVFSNEIVAQLTISDPIIVALQSEFGNVRPRIALNAANEPVVIWCASTDEKLYVSKIEGATFTTPQQLNPDGIGISSFDWYGPDIAAAGNNIAVVMKLEPEMEANSYVVMSDDGGETWSDTVLVENSLPLMSRMPSIGMNENGNPYVTFLREDMIGFSEWAMAKSIDGGQSFLPAVSTSVNFTDEVCDCCPSATLVNGENVIALYRNNEDNLRDIRASISNDSGETFTSQADMDDLDWVINACPSTGPVAYVANNKIYSAWMSDATGDSRIYFSSYDLQSETFEGSTEVNEAESNVTQNFPSMDGDENITSIVYEILQTGQRNIQFAYSTSADGFVADEVLDITTEVDGNQIRPDIAYADGVFHLVYTDNGNNAVLYQTITGFVGVQTISVEGEVFAYPNPASSEVTIRLAKSSDMNSSILVLDESGKTIEVPIENSNNQIILHIEHLSPGSYSVVSDGRQLTHFVKQ